MYGFVVKASQVTQTKKALNSDCMRVRVAYNVHARMYTHLHVEYSCICMRTYMHMIASGRTAISEHACVHTYENILNACI